MLADAEKHLKSVAKTTVKADTGKDMLLNLKAALDEVWTPALADHIRERTERGQATVRIELPAQAFPEPKTVADWQRLLTYFVDRITVDGAGGVLTLHYDGVLGRPFPMTLDTDGEAVEIESQRR